MLLALIQWLADSTSLGWLRVFNYLTLRAVLAALTAFFIALALGPAVIRELRKLKVGQAVRQYGPKSHLVKEGTPTMGGILILIAVGASTINSMLAMFGLASVLPTNTKCLPELT